MKKYRLRVNDKKFFSQGDMGKYKISENYYNHKYLFISSYKDYVYNFCSDGSAYFKSEKSKFTQEQIDLMPYGLVNKLEKEEVKEQLYYIKMPYVENQYINHEVKTGGNYALVDKCLDVKFKSRFTLEEVKKYYPLYANDNFLVKVEDVQS